MEEPSQPWYMYKRITTVRDVALLLSDFIKHKGQDPVWFTLPDLLEFIELEPDERVRILRYVKSRLHHRYGLDRLVYVYGVQECSPAKKRTYRFTRKIYAYLIGTSAETRIRDMSGLSQQIQKNER